MAQTLFRGPVLQGKFNEAGVTGFNLENKSSNYTVTAADSGKTFTSATDGVVFTLPAISIGRVYTFVNTASDGTNTLTISPNANDGILYAGSLTDDKDLINTKTTSKVGDFVVIASLNSTAHWTVVDAQGIFAKEA
jgi:sporulation protein YlmC with PRC-barrel domain